MKKPLLILALLAFAAGLRADDNAAKLALAREAIAAMQMDKMLDAMTAGMKQMAAQSSPLPASATPEQRQKFEAFMGKVVEISMAEAQGMLAKMDAVYAEVYSEAELKAMVAFFQSPEGKSMIAKQPQVMTRVMPLVQQMQQSLMPKMQKLTMDLRAELGLNNPPIPANGPIPLPSSGNAPHPLPGPNAQPMPAPSAGPTPSVGPTPKPTP